MRMANPHVTIAISIAILFAGLVLVAGCRRKAAPTTPSTPAVTAKEGAASTAAPFPDAAGKTAELIAGAVKEQPSILNTEKLGRLHISGLALLAVALAARFLFGTWKDAYVATGLGVIPSVLAVLLTEYSRVVLLIPLCGLVIVGFVLFRRFMEMRSKAKGFDAAATVIEQADTGKNSLGQLMKNRIGESGVKDVVDKALKPLETIWNKIISA